MVKGKSDGEEIRKRIVIRAKQLFVQKGYAAVTMKEVCEAADCTALGNDDKIRESVMKAE